jgi:hypothetical protein
MMAWFLCALSSFLLVLSFPDFNISVLAWIGFVPLFFALDGQKSYKALMFSYCAGALFTLALSIGSYT